MVNTGDPSNAELGHVRDGYPALAAWIARDPDSETFVFRKFDRLGARNILHLQSKLIALEHDIDQLDEQARQSKDFASQQSSRRWETLMERSQDSTRPEKERVEKLEELQGLLKNYYEVLLLHAQIADLKGPSSRVLTAFRHYLEGRAFKGDGLPIISGRAKDFLADKSDLVSLRRLAEEDLLSRLLQDHWVFQKRTNNDPLDCTTTYKNRHVVHTVTAISMVLAALLLIGAIISLHFVTRSRTKLGLVTVYMLLFAMSVALLTNARRAEVFAATAAYAAVLVVFVSGDLGNSNSAQCLIQLESGIFKTVRCPD
ncbi:hypothetical protein K491DRAFT_781433 [Lophiostoma macrostomum CBS 122681]|uniref:DUF6594 domain-containing protein n=1 Tax=Lophiostoma macrostomum CBS 122681 TaxID=1314788 RepID=A0A6A6SW68_9PLEO|nr:hypothetical protein K491DRAFT_781433 [Lophiostoma macrostomum CBS 122681]